MADKTTVVFTADRFLEVEHHVSRTIEQEVRRATQATEGRAKQLIILWDAIQTGDMYRNVVSVLTNRGLRGHVESRMPYSSYVHDGTRHMRPRPFLSQAVKDILPGVKARLNRILEGL